MKMAKNFAGMPFALKVILGVSVLAPVFLLGTILSGGLGVVGRDPIVGYGKAGNAIELLLIFISSLPMSLCALLIVNGVFRARYWYIVTWVALIASPILMETTRKDVYILLVESSFGLIVGAAISYYIVFGDKPKQYFSRKN